jgi:hypothetical protein
MSEFTPLREAVDTLASRRPSPDFGELQRRATRRGRRRVVMVAAATAVVIAGSVLAIAERDHDRRTAPVEQPKVVVGAVPVWYDAKGLHRGDVVEQTPVPPMTPAQVADLSTSDEFQLTPGNGVLALLRSGALYLDPATGDVWFHPWGGDPRIVGHNSIWGPGGDPNGDTAAWFEGPYAQDGGPGELVVYDTATGRVISRTQESHAAESGCCEHRAPENSFLDVSAKRVVWDSGPKTYSHHVRTRTTRVVHLSELKLPGGPEQYPNLEAFGTPAPAATTS